VKSHAPERSHRRHRCTACELDRATARAAVSKKKFSAIEALRTMYSPGEEQDESFWRMVREKVITLAAQSPDAALTFLRARVGRVCAALGMSVDDADKLIGMLDTASLVQAAESNHSILEFRKDPRYKDLWPRESIRQNPPVRVEFEHAIVFATINEAVSIAKGKTWGSIVKIQGLLPEDVLYPLNISYTLKATSRQRMCWEWRGTLRNLLGSDRRLVTMAMRASKSSFITELTNNDARTIRKKLDLEPPDFWVAVRHGDRFGPNGIEAFVERLEETRKGYKLDFGSPSLGPVQIQPLQ
jgi:hypothetical protein